MHIKKIQPQCVRDDAKAGKAHRRRAEHGIERNAHTGENARRDGNADGVIEERPEQVFFDVAQCRPPKTNRGGGIAEAPVHKHDIGRVYSNVRAGADCDTDIRAGKSGSVVYSVPHHYNLAFRRKLSYDAFFAVRQNSGDNFVNSGAFADCFGGTLVVAGEHNDAKPHIFELFNSLGAVGLYGVGNGDYAEQLVVRGKKQGRLALRGKFGGDGFIFSRSADAAFDKVEISAAEENFPYLALKSVSGESVKFADGGI